MDTPWLDASFLIPVLQSVENTKSEVDVIKFKSSAVVPAGMSYCSLLYRVNVDYKVDHAGSVQSTSLIVKIPLESGDMKMFLEKAGVYEAECKVYNEILPKLYELDNLQLTAKSYFCPLNKGLVLEDLKLKGFVMADRLKQLDYNHCKLVLEGLAKLHALSVAVRHKHPGLLENTGVHLMYNDTVEENDKKLLRDINAAMVRALVEEVETVDGCSMYADKIQERIASHWDKASEFVRTENGLSVLNLGDFWTNNIMFKYNSENELINVRFVDFQCAIYSTYVTDLSYFWWSSANEEVRENHRDELFEVYRQTLNEHLNDFGCAENLSKEDFDNQMKTSGPYVLYILSGVLPVAMAEPHDIVVFNKLNTEEFIGAPNKKNLQSKHFKKIIRKTLQQMDELGLLDYKP